MLLAQSQINAIKSLEEKNFFKLVCGASLNDLLLIENLSFLFTLAGADVIDLAARADVILSCRRGINKAKNQEPKTKSPLIMASIQLDKDPHFRKVEVNYDKCDLCGVCVNVCPTEAFAIGTRDQGPGTSDPKYMAVSVRDSGPMSYVPSPKFVYKPERCFGCDACPPACHVSALSMAEMEFNPSVTITEMIDLEVDAIEFHFGKNYEGIKTLWDDNNIRDKLSRLSLISFSIGSELLSEEEIKKAGNLCFKLAGAGIILQCDGKPMSGGFKRFGNNMDNSTIKVAEILQKEKLPVFLQLSGGTDEKTYIKARNAGLDINGVALGSYARKLLMPYLSIQHLESDMNNFNLALNIAQSLVSSVKGSRI